MNWQPTHTIRTSDGRTDVVMLDDCGGFTRAEWDSGLPPSWHCDNGSWLPAFRCGRMTWSVERVTRWRLVTMAADGVSVSASSAGASLSGPTLRDLPRLLDECAEGAWVLDLRAVEADEALRQSLRGPLPDCSRDGGEMEASPVDEQTAPIVEAFGLAGACLDRVGLEVYCAGWQALGARVGRVRGGAVVWEVEL